MTPPAAAPTVDTIMHRAPLTTAPKELLSVAQALMRREGLHQLPVVENGVLVGILAERDLHAHTGYLERTKVDAAMTSTPISIGVHHTAREAARLLIDKQINALPVVDGDQLVGIVTRTDLLRVLLAMLDQLGGAAA